MLCGTSDCCMVGKDRFCPILEVWDDELVDVVVEEVRDGKLSACGRIGIFGGRVPILDCNCVWLRVGM